MVNYLEKENVKKPASTAGPTEWVWREFRTKLHHFILSRVRDEHLAEDLLQETFLRIHNGVDSLKRMDRLQFWGLPHRQKHDCRSLQKAAAAFRYP